MSEDTIIDGAVVENEEAAIFIGFKGGMLGMEDDDEGVLRIRLTDSVDRTSVEKQLRGGLRTAVIDAMRRIVAAEDKRKATPWKATWPDGRVFSGGGDNEQRPPYKPMEGDG